MLPLTIRLCNWIGDVVLSLPALELLAAHGYALNLYGKPWASTLLSGYDWPVTKRSAQLKQRVSELKAIRMASLQRDPDFDKRINALSLPNSFSAALELRLSGHKTCGYAKDGRSFLMHDVHQRLQNKHVVETFWHLACQIIGEHPTVPTDIRLKLSASAVDRADQLLASHGLSGQPFACVAPFATGMMQQFDKKWPHFGDFIERLAQDLPLIICPGPGEEADAELHEPHAKILHKVPLDVYAALMARAALVAANDTGPGHLAAAVGTPLISVLGPTDPQHWAPWGSQVHVVLEWPQWPAAASVHDTALRLLQR